MPEIKHIDVKTLTAGIDERLHSALAELKRTATDAVAQVAEAAKALRETVPGVSDLLQASEFFFVGEASQFGGSLNWPAQIHINIGGSPAQLGSIPGAEKPRRFRVVLALLPISKESP